MAPGNAGSLRGIVVAHVVLLGDSIFDNARYVPGGAVAAGGSTSVLRIGGDNEHRKYSVGRKGPKGVQEIPSFHFTCRTRRRSVPHSDLRGAKHEHQGRCPSSGL